MAVLSADWTVGADGAGVVPLVAVAGLVIAAIRRRPERTITPVRAVSTRLAGTLALGGAGLTTLAVLEPQLAANAVGPAITIAAAAIYLALFGFRSLALLRTVMLLSLLTWRPIGDALHTIVRSSLDQPSDLVYQRLATLSAFGVDAEPWLLFTASLHRGSRVVIGVIVLGVAASRWRLSPIAVVDVAVSATIALIVHHAVLLASPLDEYDPAETTELATNPVLEVAIAAVAVLVLAAVRRRRARRDGVDTTPPAALDEIAARDPVIFSAGSRHRTGLTTVLLVVATAPLIALALDDVIAR